MRRRVELAVLVVLSVLAGASTCDNQDLSGRFAIDVAAGEGSAVGAYEQSYIGRLTLDFGLRNTGSASGDFRISVQAQTSGAQDEDACEDGVRTTPRLLDAGALSDDGFAAAGADVPILRNQNRSHFITLPSGEDAGVIRVRFRETSTYRLYVSGPPESVQLYNADGTDVDPSNEEDAPSCDLFESVIEYDLTDGTYGLRLFEDGLTVLLEEACSSVRTVPRTCPGAVSDVYTRDTIRLDADGFVSGRIASTVLGVGDRAVVSLECDAATPDCAAELEFFFLVQQLECRIDSDCSAVEACTEDGYCRRVRDRGCVVAGVGARSGVPDWLVAGVVLLASVLGRRRWPA